MKLEALNKFGVIAYKYNPWIPLSYRSKGITEDGIELFEVQAISAFVGWERNRTYPTSFVTGVPYDIDSEYNCIAKKFSTTRLFVAHHEASVKHMELWDGRPTMASISYASDKSFNKAAGQVRRELKRRMMKQMEV